MPGRATSLISEQTLTIFPVPRRTIPGARARASRNAPVRFVARTRSHTSGATVRTLSRCWMPALLTRMSRPPAASASATPAATADGSVTSKATADTRACGPASAMTCAPAASTAARFRPCTTTAQPARARPTASARPIPRLEPVTSARRPRTSNRSDTATPGPPRRSPPVVEDKRPGTGAADRGRACAPGRHDTVERRTGGHRYRMPGGTGPVRADRRGTGPAHHPDVIRGPRGHRRPANRSAARSGDDPPRVPVVVLDESGLADRPDVAGTHRGHRGEPDVRRVVRVRLRRLGYRDDLPGAAVPVLDQRLVEVVTAAADRPDVVGVHHGQAGQRVEVGRRLRGRVDNGPLVAVPVLYEDAGAVAGRLRTDRPDVGRGPRRHRGQPAAGRGRHHAPPGTVVVQRKRVGPAGAHGPDVLRGHRGDSGQAATGGPDVGQRHPPARPGVPLGQRA